MLTFFFLLWIILNGRVTLELVLLGIVISAAVFWFGKTAFGYSIRLETVIWMNVPLAFVYALNLVLEIIKAALAVGAITVHPAGKPDPVLIEFDSGFQSSFQNVILANSITLTPGTVTVELTGDHFKVHCLMPQFADGIEECSFVKLLRRMHGVDAKGVRDAD